MKVIKYNNYCFFFNLKDCKCVHFITLLQNNKYCGTFQDLNLIIK